MNEIAVKKDLIPVKPIQRVRLSKPIDKMECIFTLCQIASHFLSDTHKATVHNLMTTIAEAEDIKNSYGGRLPPDVEEFYAWLTQQYLDLMKSIMQHYSAQLLDEMRSASQGTGDVSLLMWARAWLGF